MPPSELPEHLHVNLNTTQIRILGNQGSTEALICRTNVSSLRIILLLCVVCNHAVVTCNKNNSNKCIILWIRIFPWWITSFPWWSSQRYLGNTTKFGVESCFGEHVMFFVRMCSTPQKHIKSTSTQHFGIICIPIDMQKPN